MSEKQRDKQAKAQTVPAFISLCGLGAMHRAGAVHLSLGLSGDGGALIWEEINL
ncbi:MAG: hypothetical protein KAY73_02395 [Giesbergeria sp.]|nr:hypothetical protein [Giesbergeria sp.]